MYNIKKYGLYEKSVKKLRTIFIYLNIHLCFILNFATFKPS